MATSYPVGGNVRWEGHEYVESVGTFSRRKRWTHAADLVQCRQSFTWMFQRCFGLPCSWLGVGLVLDGERQSMVYLRMELGYREVVEEVAGREFEDVVEFCRWMGEGTRILGQNGSNGFAVFEGVVRKKSLEDDREEIEEGEEGIDGW